jgi:hypothetical protein
MVSVALVIWFWKECSLLTDWLGWNRARPNQHLPWWILHQFVESGALEEFNVKQGLNTCWVSWEFWKKTDVGISKSNMPAAQLQVHFAFQNAPPAFTLCKSTSKYTTNFVIGFYESCKMSLYNSKFRKCDAKITVRIKVEQLMSLYLSAQGRLDPRGGLCCFF